LVSSLWTLKAEFLGKWLGGGVLLGGVICELFGELVDPLLNISQCSAEFVALLKEAEESPLGGIKLQEVRHHVGAGVLKAYVLRHQGDLRG
jgi:hypothetical protein